MLCLPLSFLHMEITSLNAARVHLSLTWIKLHIIGESVSGSSGDTPPSPSTHGGGGGGRGDTSELRLGGKGRTKAGWRWRREARNPSQAAISLSAAFTCRRERLVDVFITNVVESRDRSLEHTGSKLLFYRNRCEHLLWSAAVSWPRQRQPGSAAAPQENWARLWQHKRNPAWSAVLFQQVMRFHCAS